MEECPSHQTESEEQADSPLDVLRRAEMVGAQGRRIADSVTKCCCNPNSRTRAQTRRVSARLMRGLRSNPPEVRRVQRVREATPSGRSRSCLRKSDLSSVSTTNSQHGARRTVESQP